MTAIIARPAVGATQAAPVPGKASEEPNPRRAQQAVSVSPSLIVLTIRPDGLKFNGNRIERAQEAGFGFLRRSGHIGFADPDTGKEIARHVVNNNDEAFGTLREIQVHVDPEHCEPLHRCGTELFAMLQKYCTLIGGHLCDGTGNALAHDACREIAEHIDAVSFRRRKERLKARVVRMPSGEIRETDELSFSYTVVREAGKRRQSRRYVYFDAPALPFYEGRARGYEMAKELVAFYQAHSLERPYLDRILREAIEKSERHPYGDFYRTDVSNVAAGFLHFIEEMVALGCRHVNPAWLNHKISSNRALHAENAVAAAKEKAEIVARLRAGREAAKARRLTAKTKVEVVG
ncbi:hypothetical protein [uncultured Xylophilus sp.]|uniref:hypothetical protein n=1 Tax=uncultured Xylophilus sp. TaxID=296832 RepID=UPI0025FCE621|nr:hypothetical protein [uncultured Xylophilus sp.]